MLSYAGVNLLEQDAGAMARFYDALSPADLRDFARATWPGRLESLGFPWLEREQAPVLNRLVWPTGASRCATGWFLIDDAGLAVVRPLAYSNASSLTPLPFVMNDGQASITTNLYMLPPRPLGQCLTGGDLYLLCLVDARYFWWDMAATISVAAGTTTWAQLFASLGAALGVSLTVDPIPAAYLTPPADFNTQFEYLPQQLDAAARSVGMRVVAGLDGSVAVRAPQTKNVANVQQELVDLKLNPLTAGGLIRLIRLPDKPDLLDLPGTFPASVTVVFPAADSTGAPTGANTNVPVTLVSLIPNLASYAASVTNQFTHLLYSSVLVGSGNAAEGLAYARQAATDWYTWQQSPVDASYAGVCPWVPTGFEDRIEWNHRPNEIFTRVQRPPWNVRHEAMLAYGTYGSSNGGCGGLTVIGQNDVTVAGVDRIVFAGNDVNAGPTDVCGKTAIVQPTILRVDSGGGSGSGVGCDISLITIDAFGCVFVFDECNQTLYLFCGGKLIWCQPTGPCLPSGSGSRSGSGGACLTYACLQCLSGASIAFEVTPEGVTAGVCTDPAVLNKTFTLNYWAGVGTGSVNGIEEFCGWISPRFSLCGQTCLAFWLLEYVPQSLVYPQSFWILSLSNNGVPLATYTASGVGWNCDSPLSLAFHLESANYDTWPETLTIVPTCRQATGPCDSSGGPVVTTCCPGVSLPGLLHASIPGFGIATFPIVYDGLAGSPVWKYGGVFGSCSALNPPTLSFLCPVLAGTGGWSLTTAAGPTVYFPSSYNCGSCPSGGFQVVFTGVDLTACGGPASATVTVSC